MKSSGIGGQAVLEGVMMKNGKEYAIAVRKPDGEIEIKIPTRALHPSISCFACLLSAVCLIL